ncbi:hypothetical protein GF373_12245, partial [bacterium]|nr:hypothetical protein [bacterium]
HRPETLLKLHRLHTAEGEIDCIFRNHALSDRIGFVYRSWDAKGAANNFIQQIKERFRDWHESTPPLVNVILDGENCWEFYPRDGNDFLNYLIEGILNEPQIHPTTVPEFREQFPPSPSLHSIFPGSWINNNFRIWVGHQEDNAAWHFLRQAREDLAKHEQNVEKSIRQEAWKLLYIAEGSDWFWWYGDDHQSDYGDVFDALFRNHIKRVYTLLGLEPPEALKRPIPQPMITQKGGGILFKEPDVSTPVKRYYDWVGAKKLEVKSGGGAMHQATDVEAELRYGRFDNHLCFTIKLKNSDLLSRNPAISVHVTKPIIKTLPVFPVGKAGKGNLHDHRFEGVVAFDPSEISSQQELWFFIQIDVEGEPKVTLPSGTELYLQGYTHANACIYWFA